MDDVDKLKTYKIIQTAKTPVFQVYKFVSENDNGTVTYRQLPGDGKTLTMFLTKAAAQHYIDKLDTK